MFTLSRRFLLTFAIFSILPLLPMVVAPTENVTSLNVDVWHTVKPQKHISHVNTFRYVHMYGLFPVGTGYLRHLVHTSHVNASIKTASKKVLVKADYSFIFIILNFFSLRISTFLQFFQWIVSNAYFIHPIPSSNDIFKAKRSIYWQEKFK